MGRGASGVGCGRLALRRHPDTPRPTPDTPGASRRDLPSVDRLLRSEPVRQLLEREPRALVVDAARQALAEARAGLRNGGWPHTVDELPRLIEERVREALAPRLRPVVNATGVVIHTNLGRAPLSDAALAAANEAGRGYSNLEYELERGERGSRHDLVTPALQQLTGAEAALVVNNNAAALLLILSALAVGREVVISRGELVEIGGGVRIPDVLRQSGAHLVEVGTTNRTYGRDYAQACGERTALLLRVHSSNFLQLGFTHAPSLVELAELAGAQGLPLVEDLGSGSLLDTTRFGVRAEPMVQDSVAAGCDLVCFSGDKLLGGPQAGIIVGRRAAVASLRGHPLVRALRPDKVTLAALGATLGHYLRGEAIAMVPVWRMLAASLDALTSRARALADGLPGVELVPSRSTIGGGSLPGETQPSVALALGGSDAEAVAAALRGGSPPVVGRIEQARVLLDLRSVLPEQDPMLRATLRHLLHR
ncbi:MAG: L-seryl-tRNA(Sec) selenium transferase [Chloroflexi bacterium]|nr:L-seryl-tRNA(Sec) selenium transferase [Chloroflexota bacterium]